ncbi:MAG: hypothetical protein ACI3Y9_02410 [Candidatus Cryptobacteroides sp.]
MLSSNRKNALLRIDLPSHPPYPVIKTVADNAGLHYLRGIGHVSTYAGTVIVAPSITMRSTGKPVSAGEVATLSGLDRKEVDKAFAQLKKDGAIVSPVRCKWQPAE